MEKRERMGVVRTKGGGISRSFCKKWKTTKKRQEQWEKNGGVNGVEGLAISTKVLKRPEKYR